MKQIIVSLILPAVVLSCHNKKQPAAANAQQVESVLIEISEKNNTPTVDLPGCKLVPDPSADRKADAARILEIKRKWPLAMQSKKPADFDSILGQHFTYKDHEFFFTRKVYIDSRTKPDDWIITHVKYENVTLQFAGNTGILTYKNRVTNKHIKTGEIEYEKIAWMDIFEQENGRWKIAAAHAIDYNIEPTVK